MSVKKEVASFRLRIYACPTCNADVQVFGESDHADFCWKCGPKSTINVAVQAPTSDLLITTVKTSEPYPK